MKVYNRPDLSAIMASGALLTLLVIGLLCGTAFGWQQHGWFRPRPRLADVPIYPQARNVVRQDTRVTFQTDDPHDQVLTFYGAWAGQHDWSGQRYPDPPPLSWVSVPYDPTDSTYVWPSPEYPTAKLSISTQFGGTDLGEELKPVTVTIALNQQAPDGSWPTATPDPNQPTLVPQPPLPTPIPTATGGR